MNTPPDVISALLDDEPFDPEELLMVLREPEGRALLVDLAMLRRVVQPSAAVPPLASFVPVQRKWPLLAAAAAVLVALAGGYVAGTRQTVDVSAGAPPATRIVQAIPFTPTGGHQ